MRAPQVTMARARRLRRTMTLPETILWQRLRRLGVDGVRFRRQHPIGPYVLDFYCPDARLAVEVDGAAHDHPGQATRDTARDIFLTERGIRVLRLPGRDVLRGDAAEHVIPTIAAGLRGRWSRRTPSTARRRSPSPAARVRNPARTCRRPARDPPPLAG